MFFRHLLRLCNAVVSAVMALGLILSGTYGAYALWDNSHILAKAENIRSEMLTLKPQVEDGTSEEERPSFEALLEVNPDVCGWITLENTNIDYPILQGKTNLSYINTDVYGEFSLAGSIFLDTRCSREMDDEYSLVYGHHVVGGNMFGDLDLYKDRQFFCDNGAGVLLTPEGQFDLWVFACLVTGASEERIFQPTRWDSGECLQFIRENSLFFRQEALEQGENRQVLALSTCASEFTDARTIVLAVMRPHAAGGTGGDVDE